MISYDFVPSPNWTFDTKMTTGFNVAKSSRWDSQIADSTWTLLFSLSLQGLQSELSFPQTLQELQGVSVWVSLKVGATPQSHPLSHGLSWFITVYHHLPHENCNVALLRPRSLGAGQGSSIIMVWSCNILRWIRKDVDQQNDHDQNWGSKNLAWSKHEPFKILTIG